MDGAHDGRPDELLVLHRAGGLLHPRSAPRSIARPSERPSCRTAMTLKQAPALNHEDSGVDAGGVDHCATRISKRSGAHPEMRCATFSPASLGGDGQGLERDCCEQERLVDNYSHVLATICPETLYSTTLSDCSWTEYDEELWPGLYGTAMVMLGRYVDSDVDVDDAPGFLDSLD